MVVGGTSYYIEAIIYDNLVRRAENEDEDEDDNDGEPTAEVAADTVNTSVEAFREYAPFRNFNDPPTADGVDAAGRMYADALAEAVRFGRGMPAVERLPFKRYRNTFVTAAAAEDDRARWPSTVASVIDCESAALYAHGVRVLDAVAAADARVRYEVLAADVTAGLRERYTYADVRSRLDAVLSATGTADGTAVKDALCRAYEELEKRTQRLALAVLADNERVSVALMTPHALKAHAAYFDPVAANELHPHNTRKVFRYVQRFSL